MIKGEIGFIDDEARLHIDSSLFEGIFVNDGNVLFGIYYPPKNTEEYKKNIIEHDLMLTPIPFEFWPTVVRLVIRMKHDIDAIRQVCSELKENDVSILNANSSRSGYRFATWNLHINFDALKGSELKYDSEKCLFVETSDATDRLIEQLHIKCGQYLFDDPRDIDLKDPIVVFRNTALAYFYAQSRELRKANDHLYNSFSLKCEGNIISSKDGDGLKLRSLFKQLSTTNAIYPSIIFSETDTNYLNLRVAIIPKKYKDSVFRVIIDYSRIGGDFSSKGLFHFVLSKLPKGYKVWKFYNHTKEMKQEFEVGKIYLLILKENKVVNQYQEQKALENVFSSLKNSVRELGSYEFKHEIRAINYYSIQSDFELKAKKRRKIVNGLFISYADEDKAEAEKIFKKAEKLGLNPAMDKKTIRSGEYWENELKDAIAGSFEFCGIYSSDWKEREWLTIEWGAAWILDRRITIIPLGIEAHSLPDHLRRVQVVKVKELQKYLRDVKERWEDWKARGFVPGIRHEVF